MKVGSRAVQVAGGSLGLMPEAKPLTQALLYRWLQAFCFLGSATARYSSGNRSGQEGSLVVSEALCTGCQLVVVAASPQYKGPALLQLLHPPCVR